MALWHIPAGNPSVEGIPTSALLWGPSNRHYSLENNLKNYTLCLLVAARQGDDPKVSSACRASHSLHAHHCTALQQHHALRSIDWEFCGQPDGRDAAPGVRHDSQLAASQSLKEDGVLWLCRRRIRSLALKHPNHTIVCTIAVDSKRGLPQPSFGWLPGFTWNPKAPRDISVS